MMPGLHWRGPHDPTVRYRPGSVALDGGVLYVCILDTLAVFPAPAPSADPTHWSPLDASVPLLHGPYTVLYSDVPDNGSSVELWTPQVGDALLALHANPATTVAWDFGEVTIKVGTAELANTNDGIARTTPYFFTATTPVTAVFTIGGGDTSHAGRVDMFALVARALIPGP